MYKLLVVLFAIAFAAALAEPKPSGLLAAAPLAAYPAVAPAVVTAQSSQVVARNYNALVAAAPLVAAPPPVVAAVRAPLVAPGPIVAAPSPYVAAGYRVAAPALASPYLAAPAPVLYVRHFERFTCCYNKIVTTNLEAVIWFVDLISRVSLKRKSESPNHYLPIKVLSVALSTLWRIQAVHRVIFLKECAAATMVLHTKRKKKILGA
ncbi:hypothetical protein NQ317_017379 [Molorchus minor]|uniref:Uncharacterized protein n=1 Tax=Molorchus minor TaxID=1323400 RepID=A0ABQ9JDQ9_9CUCU|nr:hypothetical protein NQ317_017379 [Molorchus minor]